MFGCHPLELFPVHRYRNMVRHGTIDLNAHVWILERAAVPAPRPVVRGNVHLSICFEPRQPPAQRCGFAVHEARPIQQHDAVRHTAAAERLQRLLLTPLTNAVPRGVDEEELSQLTDLFKG